MSKEWRRIRIGDLGEVITGRTPSSQFPELFGTEFPFITPTDMDGQAVYATTERFLSHQGYESQKRILLPPDSICFVCIGATIGKICLTKRPSFTNQQINSVVVDRANHDPRFVFHLLRWSAERIKGIAGGAATPIVNKSAFSDVDVLVPKQGTQQRIGEILGAYDDLIENNARRITILEQMAQTLYREWFVNFRFPGHEKVKMVESEMGLIPKGWTPQSISSVLTIRSETINPARFAGEVFLHFSFPAFDLNRLPSKERGATIMSNKFMVSPGCILVSKLNPRIQRIWIPDIRDSYRAIASTEFLVLEPKVPETVPYLWQLFSSDEFRGQFQGLALGTSTSHQRVKPGDFLNIISLVPPQSLVTDFCSFVGSVVKEVAVLRRTTDNLKLTRDLLLPKLVSGEVSVENLEREAVAQMV